MLIIMNAAYCAHNLYYTKQGADCHPYEISEQSNEKTMIGGVDGYPSTSSPRKEVFNKIENAESNKL